jgi:hypothetical protein
MWPRCGPAALASLGNELTISKSNAITLYFNTYNYIELYQLFMCLYVYLYAYILF